MKRRRKVPSRFSSMLLRWDNSKRNANILTEKIKLSNSKRNDWPKQSLTLLMKRQLLRMLFQLWQEKLSILINRPNKSRAKFSLWCETVKWWKTKSKVLMKLTKTIRRNLKMPKIQLLLLKTKLKQQKSRFSCCLVKLKRLKKIETNSFKKQQRPILTLCKWSKK